MSDEIFYGDEIIPFEPHQIVTYDSSDHGMLQMAGEVLQSALSEGKEVSDRHPISLFMTSPASLQDTSFAYVSLTIAPEKTGKIFRCQMQGEKRRIVYKGSSLTEALVGCIRSASRFVLPEIVQEQIPEREEVCHMLYKIWKEESFR